nr:MAG TPA: hypothetical protein [Inoviridae sp.]
MRCFLFNNVIKNKKRAIKYNFSLRSKCFYSVRIVYFN